jgi:hypothetical protein
MGGSTTVPAGATVDVLADLSKRMSLSAIGRALGTSHNYIARVISGDIKRMQPSRHAAIMALGNYQPTDSSHVTALGTARRLQALHALGYSYARLEREVGCYGVRSIKDVVHGRLTLIEAQHAAAVAETYERLSMRLPVATSISESSGITRARNTARTNGWPPPLAWDDIDRDKKPAAGGRPDVDPVVVDRMLGGDMSLARSATKAEKVAVVAGWTGSLNELERLTGWQAYRYREDVA